MRSLWIVDDNLALLRSLEFVFQGEYHIQTFSDPITCLLAFKQGSLGQPEIILTDFKMKDWNGLEMLEAILRVNPQIKTYLMSACLTREIMVEACRLGVKGWVGKPFDLVELKGMLKA